MLEPDRDLGKCIREGRRNIAADDRAFGKPSCRPLAADLAACASTPPARPAPGALAGLTPPGLSPPSRRTARAFVPAPMKPPEDHIARSLAPELVGSKGVDRSEFAQPRTRREVRSLLHAAGYSFSDDGFGQVWAAAVRDFGPPGAWPAEDIKLSLSALIETIVGGRTRAPAMAMAGA
mmetsp:Transcript_136983/g.438226  ORF Transcript_136983/g.438226 Transcript_136983/m.438226 type:complete len:178 (-) Transcript_136983:134-667(-)